MAAPKLDKDHGFIKFIVNNQIDRDKYEQEQKSRKQRGVSKADTLKHRDEQKMYVPPIRGRETRGRGSKLANRSTQEAPLKNGDFYFFDTQLLAQELYSLRSTTSYLFRVILRF